VSKLGKGAFGEVFTAVEKASGFVCVIKKMSKRRIRELKVEEHVRREIKLQSYLNHSHLTALYGYFHDPDNLYLILELLPDGSLQQVKKKRKLPQNEAAALLRQVVEGLKYMHEEYVIHRDLKPENLFLNQVLPPPRRAISKSETSAAPSTTTNPPSATLSSAVSNTPPLSS
jgi:serine/threonine protein kinase